MVRFILAVALAAPVVASAEVDAPAAGAPVAGDPAPAATPPRGAQATPARSGVYFGAGLGAAALSYPGGSAASTTAVRMRIGVARSPRLMFGLEGAFLAAKAAQLSSYDVGATFFPWERLFFVRGAFGMTVLDTYAHGSEQGPNILVGVGCAFSGRPGLNLSLSVEGQTSFTAPVGGDLRHGPSHSAAAWLGVDWY